MRKPLRLKVTNFLGIADLTMQLDTHQVHAIAGPNGSGKSSLTDALKFVKTGRCRSIETRESQKGRLDYRDLVRDGARGLKVEFVEQGADGEEVWKRTRTGDPVIPRQVSLVEAYGTDPWMLTEASEPDRARLLKALEVTSAGATREQIEAAWKEVHEDKEGDATETAQVLEKLAVDGMKEAQDEAKAQRLALSRQIELIPVPHERPSQVLELEDQEPLDLLPVNVERLKQDRDAYLGREATCGQQLKQAEKGVKLRKRVRSLTERLQASPGSEGPSAGSQSPPVDPDEVRAKKREMEKLLEVVQKHGDCPFCSVITCPLGEVDSLKEASEKVLVESIEHAQGVIATAEAAEAERKDGAKGTVGLARELRDANAALTKIEAVNEEEVTAERDEAKGKREYFDGVLTKIDARLQEIKDYDRNLGQKETLLLRRRVWDRVCKSMEPGGVVHKAYHEGTAELGIDQKIAEQWGLQVDFQQDGKLLVNGRPIQLASDSERWRVAALVGDALCHRAGTGLLVLDRADCLETGNRAILGQFLSRARERHGCIIVLGTASGKSEASPLSWMKKWNIQGGVLSEVK